MKQLMTLLTLGVDSLDASARFYEDALGWKRSPMSNDDIYFYDVGGMHLSLFPRQELAKDATVDPTGEGFRGFTMACNLGSEKEVDDLIASLKAKGVRIVKEPQKVFWGGYSSYFADPDGNLWEIAYNPFLLDE